METDKKNFAKFLGSLVLLIISMLSIAMTLIFNRTGSHNKPLQQVLNTSINNQENPNTSQMSHASTEYYEQEAQKTTPLPEQNNISNLDPAPFKISAHLEKATELLDQGKASAAAILLEEILKIEPKNEQALIEMGMIQLIELKSPKDALKYLETALTINPHNKTLMLEIIDLYDEIDELPNGLLFLQSLYDENPNNINIAMGVTQILAQQNRLSEAIPILEQFVNDQNSAFPLEDLAEIYSKIGLKEKSLETYERSIELEKERIQSDFYMKNPEVGKEKLALAYLGKVSELVEQKKYSEAEEIIENNVKKLYHGNIEQLAEIFEKNRSSK